MQVCVTADVERFSDGISRYNCLYAIDDIILVRELLDALCDADIPSTLFILGKFAEEEPTLMDMVKENGHELASHGYTHVDIRTLPLSVLEHELVKSKFQAKGFRAPYYCLNREVIRKLDMHFLYDSSFIPVRTTRNMFLRLYMITDSLMEIPISTVGFLPLTSMMVRLFPLDIVKIFALYALKRDGYLIVNVHPWEFFKVPCEISIPSYVRKNTGPSFLKKFSEFLEYLKTLHVEFMSMEQMYEHYRR